MTLNFLLVSCTTNQLSYGFSLNNFKSIIPMYIAVKASENKTDINLSIYHGHDFYNDDDFLCATDCNESQYVLYIRFIHDKTDELIFSKNLDDFTNIEYDCVSNKKLDYKKNISYSINKEDLNQDGTIEMELSELRTNKVINGVYQRISYKVGKKINIVH